MLSMAFIYRFSVHSTINQNLISIHNSSLKSFTRFLLVPIPRSSVCGSVVHFHSNLKAKEAGKEKLFSGNSSLDHAAKKEESSHYVVQKCTIHSSTSLSGAEGSKRGVSFQIPNLFKWLSHWIVFREFQTTWDPDFNMQDFKRGVSQAVVRVTELVQAREWGELKGLMSQSIIDDFRLLRGPYNQELLHVMPLSTEDIEHVHIDGIRLQQVVEEKYCDLAVVVYAYKAEPDFKRDTYLTIGLRFHRNYTRGSLPSWTIHRMLVESQSVNWT